MKRAGALLSVIEDVERKIMKIRKTRVLRPEEVKAIHDEVVRAKLRRMLDRLDALEPWTEAVIDARVQALEAEIVDFHPELTRVGA